MTPRALILCLLLSIAIAPRAVAQPVDADAKAQAGAHLRRGLRLYNIQSYNKAIEEFQAGYQLDPRPVFLYSIGQAERLAGNCKLAIDAYNAFLRTGPRRSQARATELRVERCQTELANAPPPVAPAPTAATPPVAPAPIAPKTVAATPAPKATPAAPAPLRPWYKDVLGDVLTSAGIVVAGAGVALWVTGHNGIQRINGASDYGTFASQTVSNKDAGVEQAIGIGAVVAGGALITGGLLRYLLPRWRRRERRPSVTAVVGRGTTSFVFTGSF